ncbi:hypothetical protein Hanom_Chr04g00319001 [Helianthus anomalus]
MSFIVPHLNAPKEKKRKAATKKTDKSEEQVMSEKHHNMIACLDPKGKITELKEITQWIRESRKKQGCHFFNSGLQVAHQRTLELSKRY